MFRFEKKNKKFAIYPSTLRAIATDNALEPVLEPFDRFRLVDAVGGADFGLAPPSLRNALTGTSPARICQGCFFFFRLGADDRASSAVWVTHMQQ